MRQLIVFILIFTMISCSSKKANNQASNQVDSFNEFIKSLPKHNLPIKIHCGVDSAGEIEQRERFKKFIPKFGERVYGYLQNTGDSKLIIYGQVGDDIYPYLYSYDSQGEIIDSLFLIINACGAADDKLIPNSYAIIDENLNINLIDTSLFIHYPDNSKFILDSMKITRILVKLDNNGKFKQISKEMKK